MEFIKFDIHKHDINKVAELIYETDIETLNFFFKNRQNAIKIIKTLLKRHNNSWSHENVYIAVGNNNQVLGILVAYSGEKTNIRSDFIAYFKNLNFINFLKFVFMDIIDTWMGANLDKDDYYLSDLAVDKKCRSKGVGTFILNKSIKLAEEKGCKRVVLDVDIENIRALDLYKKIGFKIFNKKSIKLLRKEKGVYNMEYRLFSY